MRDFGDFKPYPKPVKSSKKTPVRLRKKSVPQSRKDREYAIKANEWIKGKTCVRCKDMLGENIPAEQVHHAKGRQGYADKYAILKVINLLMDTRFWVALCANCHDYIERNPQKAMEDGYTLTRADVSFIV